MQITIESQRVDTGVAVRIKIGGAMFLTHVAPTEAWALSDLAHLLRLLADECEKTMTALETAAPTATGALC